MTAPRGDLPPAPSGTKSHSVAGWEYALIFLAVVLLHFLPILLFRLEPPKPAAPAEKKHTNFLVRSDDPAFQSFFQRLPASSDPTIFVQGGETLGYGFILSRSDSESPSAVAVSAPPLVQPEMIRFVPAFSPDPREIDAFPAEPFLFPVPPPVTASGSGPDFPRWSGADGKRIASPVSANDALIVRLTSSRDITGPTILSIDRRLDPDIPPAVRVLRSCGSFILDSRACGALEKALLTGRGPDDRTDTVRIDWRGNVPGVRAETFPAALFQDPSGGKK